MTPTHLRSTFDAIISSPNFKFFVGPDRKPYTIHAALASSVSRPLKVLIEGPMSEAGKGAAVLDDIDEATFVRFAQWAYTGAYDSAQRELVPIAGKAENGQANAPNPVPAGPSLAAEGSAIFGTSTSGLFGSAAPITGGLFGSAAPSTGGLFGSTPASNTSSGSAFGGGATSGLFGSNPAYGTPSAASASPAASASQPSSGSLFGQSRPAPASPAASAASPPPAGGSLFGQPRTPFSPPTFTSAKPPKPTNATDPPLTKRHAALKAFLERRYWGGNLLYFGLPNDSPSEEFTKVFLSDARVYVFADKYDVANLKELALAKLFECLKRFILHEERCGDVLTLLRFVYANTMESEDEQKLDEMRDLVLSYVVLNAEKLKKHEQFREVLDDHSLAVDFVGRVMEMI